MAGIIVSVSAGVMKPLLSKLTALMGGEFAKFKGLQKEVKFLKDELSSMNDLLERLEDVEVLNPQTRGWKNQVREMAYDIEDIIDDFKHYDVGNKSDNNGFISKTIRRLKALRAKHRIAGQIEDIKTLVCESSERRMRYKLDECINESSNNVTVDQRIVALYSTKDDLVGMEGPTNEIANWLTDEKQQLKVVSIVGFGGLGKTTLANEVYHKLKGRFDSGAFVPVSQKPNITKLLSSLLSQLGRAQSSHSFELHDLLNSVREHLQDKRYFIIIDDLWDVSSWNVIKCAFPENNLGSRLIVTTRIQDVAKACCFRSHQYIFYMKPLNEKDSRKLFFNRIFSSEEECPDQLKEVSVEILKKCGGLPLAIISMASLLANESSKRKEMWEHVRNSLGTMSGTNLTLDEMREILNLSFKSLPRHLKTCLLYLGMYPEDYTIDMYDLVRRSVAEGFISEVPGLHTEEVATRYFNELINRSLIEPAGFDCKGSVTSCKLHDMMLDLVLWKSAQENFITVVDDPYAIAELHEKARRLSICSDSGNDGAVLPRNFSLSQVRSFAIFRCYQYLPPLSDFKFLRVLVADFGRNPWNDCGIVDFTGLCKLHQLRYLKITCWGECKLPTQIRGLQHLETLHLNIRTRETTHIPSDIFHLPRLRHLHVPIRTRLPDGIGEMKSLRSLFSFNVAMNSLENINGLGELTNLRALALCCKANASVEIPGQDVTDAMRSSLGKIWSGLEFLHVYFWRGCKDIFSDKCPPACRLEIFKAGIRCSFPRVPQWLGGLRNLYNLELRLYDLLEEDFGILAGLPALIYLHLETWPDSPKESITVDDKAFPVLEYLIIRCGMMSFLTFHAGAMPKLRGLRLLFRTPIRYTTSAPAGIEHLSALEEISTDIDCFSDHPPAFQSTVSALRTAIDLHPSRPRVDNKRPVGIKWPFGKECPYRNQ
ncbi:hypothetical protein ACP70R_045137 [Stipagrostis hirtigluma subsp. patula]